jgi:penicillin-binding protein 2
LQDHALFISFAPFENPEIVVSVIVDNGGSGSAVAAPIARDVMNFYFKQIKKQVATR